MPNQFTPVTTNNQSAAFNQINNNFRKLDAETVTKVFGGQNAGEKLLIGKTGDETLGISYRLDDKDRINFGKLPDGTWGLIFYDANGVPSIYMVIGNDGKPVLKVSKDGKNAQTGADSDLIFNSNQNVLKIAFTSTLVASSVPAPTGGGQEVQVFSTTTPIQSTVALGCIGYIKEGSGYGPMPYSFLVSSGNGYSGIATHYECFTDLVGGYVTFNIRVTNTDILPSTARTVKFYILQESAA